MPDAAAPPSPAPLVMSWSGGKDSCVALYELLRGGCDVRALLTTVTRDYERISMHGVRRRLLEAQAEALGLPLHEVLIPKEASNAVYEAAMAEAFAVWKARGVERVGFGDLYLEDIRAYRDALLARHGMTGLYPVWLRDTRAFIGEFLTLGFKAVVACVNGEVLGPEFAGRVIDGDFLADLPTGVDPCGENGEFHTFVFDGPIFARPVGFSVGERVQRGSFWFCDLIPDAGVMADRLPAEEDQHVQA